jgi:hypothetical protein
MLIRRAYSVLEILKSTPEIARWNLRRLSELSPNLYRPISVMLYNDKMQDEASTRKNNSYNQVLTTFNEVAAECFPERPTGIYSDVLGMGTCSIYSPTIPFG